MKKLYEKLPLLLVGLVIIGVLLFMYTNETKVLSSLPSPEKAVDTTMPSAQSKILSGSFDKSKMKTDAEWKKIITPQQYTILREAGTEVPFTGALEYEK